MHLFYLQTYVSFAKVGGMQRMRGKRQNVAMKRKRHTTTPSYFCTVVGTTKNISMDILLFFKTKIIEVFRRSFTPYFYRSTFLIFSLQVKKIYCKTTTSNNVRSVKYGSINANRKVDKHSLARYKTKT